MSWLVACWSVWPEGLGVEGAGSAAIAAAGDTGSGRFRQFPHV